VRGPREMPAAMAVPMAVLAALVVVLGLFPQVMFPVLDGGARSVLALLAP